MKAIQGKHKKMATGTVDKSGLYRQVLQNMFPLVEAIQVITLDRWPLYRGDH